MTQATKGLRVPQMIRAKVTLKPVWLACILAILATACSTKDSLPAVRDGDLIFQTSRSSQSLAIQRATGSPYSHMGLIFNRNGKPYVFEAIATVRFTPLDQWIARGAGHHFVIKRLRNAEKVLDSAGIAKLRAAALRFEGRPYDLTFEWSDERMYCSELVWKAYDRGLGIQVGALQEIRDFNLSDPAVRAKMHERYGDNIPLREPVISPVSMFRSTLLVTVADH
jgi:Permuted papain-like amidase enzyme, YaeF/YiiX, C92 family